MGADEARLGFVEDAQSVEPYDRGNAILANAVFPFGLSFRDVDVVGEVAFVGEVGQVLEVFGVDGIDRMGCDGECDIVTALLLEAVEAGEKLAEFTFGVEVVVGDSLDLRVLYEMSRYEEQVSKLETLGFKYEWGTNYLCHFFDSPFFDEDTNTTSIPEAIECLAIKDGVDLVQFSNGNYGFVAYYNGYKNGFEIIS